MEFIRGQSIAIVGIANDNVTGHMGEGEAVTPAEEVGNTVAADAAEPRQETNADADIEASEIAIPRPDAPGTPPRDGANPWQALAQVGLQFVAALASANDPRAPAHPWIDRDPATGAQHLKMPLPPPAMARQIADALSALANGLRGGIA